MLCVLVAAKIELIFVYWIMVISGIQQTGDKLWITDVVVCMFPYIYNSNI